MENNQMVTLELPLNYSYYDLRTKTFFYPTSTTVQINPTFLSVTI